MPDSPKRIIFAGTPDFAALHLEALIESKHQLRAVYTQPDRPAGRGRNIQASPVKCLAEQARLPVYQPASLNNDAARQELSKLDADVMVVVAYGLILPRPVLDIPRLGCLNIHASLLPRWRGAAPIQRALEAGDTTTGITVMQMDAGLDTGDMLAATNCQIGPDSTAGSLHDDLGELGPPLLMEVLADLQAYQSSARGQDEKGATYAAKLTKKEALIEWGLGAEELDRRVRAFNPFPVCYSFLDQDRVRIWRARPTGSGSSSNAPGTILRADKEGILVSCGEGQLAIESLQLPSGKVLTAQQVLAARGTQFAPGKQFNTPASGQT
jgi:methionyl-tRNA formyltransferase